MFTLVRQGDQSPMPHHDPYKPVDENAPIGSPFLGGGGRVEVQAWLLILAGIWVGFLAGTFWL